MKRMVYLVACLPFWLTSCEEKVTALHFNEAEQVFEIGKESELRFLNETFEIKDKNMEAQTLLTDAGKEIPADEVRIKLVKDIEISGEWTPIKFPVREFDGNGHTITFDGIRVVIEENSQGSFSAGLFDEMGGEKGTVVKDLTLAGDMTIDAQKRENSYILSVGSLAGEFKNGCIENCTSKVNISFADNKGICTLWLGGLIGHLNSYGSEVEVSLRGKVVNEGNITVNPCSNADIGGVIGVVTNYGKVFIKGDVCVENKGNLTVQWKADAQPEHNCIGGVFGQFWTNETDIGHLHNWGNIRLDTQNTSAAFNIGGVCGNLQPHNYERIYPLDLYNAGNIEIKNDLTSEYSCVGGIIGSFGGCSFHRVINEGRIVLSGKGSEYISGLLGAESPIHGNCYLHSCCKDKTRTYPVWNIHYSVSKQIPCEEKHETELYKP
ncbi:hypothetical protein HMPREF1069_04941 [Bacteroides ovatus CL02T12C04]|uniref:hypothetical protein n=1 Tax=Bacteroides ovatus TaxID=28116 RepID=UPI000268ED0F|nr:hypothetical protein [Bacteroides ovatus]EIY58451.1 hypothetical protein HMPREF1069_04941 [Bacteroides ovatus CL02T12C04]